MRPASVDWEPFSLDASSTCHGWAWFRSQAAPNGVVIRLADAVSSTLRQLSMVIGVDPMQVQMWVCFGTPCAGPAGGGSPTMLDQPLTAPAGAADPTVVIHVAPAPMAQAGFPVAMPNAMPVTMSAPMAAAVPMTPAGGGVVVDEVMYQAIEAHWSAILAETVKLDMLRKQVDSVMTQLNAANRDLNYEEKMYATRQDQDAWDDARRWLRKASLSLSKCQKACDVGDTQQVGKREWLQQVHDQFVANRQPIDDPRGTEGEFAFFRKMLITLENQVNTAISQANTDGLARARRVLAEIGAKARKARTR